MSKNPLLNAGAAVFYITAVASFMFYGPRTAGPIDAVIVPIAMLSLFVLSAAVMGFIFLYQPLRLFLEGEKERAVRLFVHTLLAFAFITGVIFGLLFYIASL